MHKIVVSFIIILLLLPGCSSIPPAFSNVLGLQSDMIHCDDVILGVLIGEDNDPVTREQRDGYDLALQRINADGGVAGCELKLKYQVEADDTNSRQTYLAVRSLIEEDKVVAFLGGTSNSASMYAASLANYFEIPVIIPSANGAHILPEENLWAFRLHAGEEAYAALVFEMVRQEMGEGTRVALLFEDTTFGNDAAVAAVNSMTQSALDVAGYFPFDPAESSYSLVIDRIQSSQAEVVYLVFSSPDQAVNILTGLNEALPNQDYLLIARGAGFATNTVMLQHETEADPISGNIILVTRHTGGAELVEGDQFYAAFSQYTQEAHGKAQSPTAYSLEAYKSLIILSDILQHELQSEPGFKQNIQQFRESLRESLFNFKENTAEWGLIDFSSAGESQGNLVLLQMISDQWHVIYPAAKAEAEPKGLPRP